MKSAAQAAQRWQTGAQGAQQTWSEGISNTTVDVASRAINAAQAAVAGFTDAVVSGRWARAIQASGGTSYWKSQSQAKAANYGVGIAAGVGKYTAFANKFMPDLQGIVDGLPARGPSGSGQNENRMLQLTRTLHQRKGNYKA